MHAKCFRASRGVTAIVVAVFALVSSGCATAGGYRFVSGNSANLHIVPSSIPHASTCARSLPDVTAALQKWIDSLPNYSGARLAPHACYHLEYPLTIGAKTALIFDGNNSTFASFTDGCGGTQLAGGHFVNCKYPSPVDALGRTQSDWPRQRYHLRLIGNVRLTVANLSIEGGKDRPGYDTDYAFQHGIYLTGRNDGTVLENISIDHVWGDFIYVGRHIANGVATYPQHITVAHSHFGRDRPYMGTGRMGIAIDGAADFHFQDNVLQYSSRSAVDIEPDSSGLLLRDIYFEHNTFGPHGNNLFANHPYGTADPVIDGVYFRYNNLKGTPLGVDSVVPNVEGINAANQSTFRRHNYQFIGNVSDTVDSTGDCNVPHWAMRFWGIDGLVIANNVQPVAAGRCMTLLDAAKLRSSRITGDVVVGAIRIAARYYESSNYCEAHNLIGKPLTADTSRLAPRCA